MAKSKSGILSIKTYDSFDKHFHSMNNYLFMLRSGEKVPPWRVIFLLIISLSDLERPDTVTATEKDDIQRRMI
jgi:hypothetical protein